MKNFNYTGSLTTTSLLGVCFIVLKLCKVIDWSWWWVTIPFWGVFALALAVLFIVIIIKQILP